MPKACLSLSALAERILRKLLSVIGFIALCLGIDIPSVRLFLECIRVTSGSVKDLFFVGIIFFEEFDNSGITPVMMTVTNPIAISTK